MRTRLSAVPVLLALVAALLVTVNTPAPVAASPADEYSGPYFGEDNFPPGCIRDMSVNNPDNICHHMRTGLNALDTPKVDVVVMVPVSATAERDMRIMRQSVEMWEGGVDYLAEEMGLGWLAEGMDFHVTVDYFDPAGDGGEFTTYPVVDPEIVVIATNPVGGIGIGVDPVDLASQAFGFTDEDGVPCHTVQNPFDFEYWENLPGFDSHHESRTGTYVEDCGGAGGNICFAINGAIDPAPDVVDVFSLFDLVSHEFGHCLTLGHVGDGAEGTWGALPSNDIMAYSQDPPGLNKCVSTLDIEGLALRMSGYLDANGDGTVDDADRLLANDQIGQGGNPFQVQHPDDHLYASSTGDPTDCPQPDLGVIPGERTDWTPTPVDTSEAVLDVTAPADGSTTEDGNVQVTGTVEHVALGAVPEPTEPTGSHDDPDDDASSPITEILEVDVAVTPTHVDATISLADLWPSTALASPTSYSVTIDGRRFDSFIRYAVDPNPMTWDTAAAAYLPAGASTWDLDAKTVSFHIDREYLSSARIEAPFYVGSQANIGLLTTAVVDDTAPDSGPGIGVSGARVISPGVVSGAVTERAGTVTFEHAGGNTFHPEDSTFGVPPFVFDRGTSHDYVLEVPQPSDVAFTLDWTGETGGSDLDLYVTGAADSGSTGATAAVPESVTLEAVEGYLDIRVEPYLVTDLLAGTTYTLTATITPLAPPPDGDGDGVPDDRDVCPGQPGEGADGCPIVATEHVHVYVDGVLTASQDVDTTAGPDAFDIPVTLPEGTHELRVEWEDDGEIRGTVARTVTRLGGTAQDPARSSSDSDGDGHSDAKERAHGTDPSDPSSFPAKRIKASAF